MAKFNFKKFIIFLGLLAFCGFTWLWMLGGLALPVDPPQGAYMLHSWSKPGVLSFPAAITVFVAIIAAGMLLTGFKKQNNDGQITQDSKNA